MASMEERKESTAIQLLIAVAVSAEQLGLMEQICEFANGDITKDAPVSPPVIRGAAHLLYRRLKAEMEMN